MAIPKAVTVLAMIAEAKARLGGAEQAVTAIGTGTVQSQKVISELIGASAAIERAKEAARRSEDASDPD